MFQLNENDYAAYYRPYLEGLPSDNIIDFLEDQKEEIMRFLQSISGDKWNHAYAPGKWTVKEVIGHVVDTEIIYGYRALSFARGEQQALPGFDENDYVRSGKFAYQDIQEIIPVFLRARELNVVLFRSIPEDDWNNVGIANGNKTKAGAIPYLVAGHARHHMRIIKERYLI